MRIRSLKHKQLIALLLIALTPLFALTASMWMQAQNSKEQAVQTYQGYADTIAIALEKELDRQHRSERQRPIARLFFCAYDGSGRKHHHESFRTLVFPANDPERPDNFRGSEGFEFRCSCLHWNARFQPQHLSAN